MATENRWKVRLVASSLPGVPTPITREVARSAGGPLWQDAVMDTKVTAAKLYDRIQESSRFFPGTPSGTCDDWLLESVSQILAIVGEREIISAAHRVTEVNDGDRLVYQGEVLALTSKLLVRSTVSDGSISTEAISLGSVGSLDISEASSFDGYAESWPRRVTFSATFDGFVVEFPLAQMPSEAHLSEVPSALKVLVANLEAK